MIGNTAGSNVRYFRDKPNDCKFCYYWQGRKKGCLMGEHISSVRKCPLRIAGVMVVHTVNIRPAFSPIGKIGKTAIFSTPRRITPHLGLLQIENRQFVNRGKFPENGPLEKTIRFSPAGHKGGSL